MKGLSTLVLSLGFMLSACHAAAPKTSETKIVRGHPVSETSPAFASAVRVEMGGALCTGTIIGPRLIITASHCVEGTTADQIHVYFDHYPNATDTLRSVSKVQMFKPFGPAVFPNFDVAYLVLSTDIPAGYTPTEVLKDPSTLNEQTPILLAGYGKQADVCQDANCIGQLREANTGFNKYYDKAHLMSLLVFHGSADQGLGAACNGDSGGPAYAQVNGKWFLIGVTNGTRGDITPESDGSCAGGWDIYTFAGDYLPWIQKDSGAAVQKADPATNPDRATPPLVVSGVNQKDKPRTWTEWVNYANHEDPAWYTIDTILENLVYTSDQIDASVTAELYDATVTEERVQNLDSLYLSGELVTDLSPLKVFPALKELTLDSTEVTDLSAVSDLPGLTYLGVRSFGAGAPDTVINTLGKAGAKLEELDLDTIKASTVNAIDWSALPSIKSVSLNKTQGAVDLSRFKPQIAAADGEINLSASDVEGSLSLAGTATASLALDHVHAADGTPVQSHIDWTSLAGLTSLSLNAVDSLPDFQGLAKLETLKLRADGLKDLSALSLPAALKTLDVSSNQLASLAFDSAKNLAQLTAFDNPLTDTNCGAQACSLDIFSNPASLDQLCANAVDAKKSDFEEPYYATLFTIQRKLSGEGERAFQLSCDVLVQNAGRARFLDLSDSDLSDLRPLAFFNGLKSLSLDSNGVSDIAPLTHLEGLTTLTLSGNAIKTLPSLAGMKNLGTLDISDNPVLSATIDAPLLKKLYLGLSNVSDTLPEINLAFPDDYGLEGILMAGVNFSAATNKAVHALPALRTLYFADDRTVDAKDWADVLNLSLIASHQTDSAVCPLINGSCTEQSDSASALVYGPLLGTTAGTRLQTTDSTVYLPGFAPIQLAGPGPF